jgi:nitrite reductase/ring-hydroxylating ferredoxin subunit
MRLAVLATDGLTLRNAGRLATAMQLEVTEVSTFAEIDTGEEPAAVVVDLELDQGMAAVGESKARWPMAMVIGLVTMPGGDLWRRAEAVGCDLVTTRGALAKAAPKRLSMWMEDPGGRRLRLFALSDVAGRLGVVERIDDRAAGPLAVYHVGGEIRVAQDSCPHAGALLSHGEVDVDAGVVTCPGHGSRFGVNTGDRVRGPADDGLETFRVVIEDGQVYVQIDSG